VRFYERLLEVIGRPELRHHPLLPDPPWGLMAHDAIAFIAPILEEAFESEPRDVWLRRLRAADIPAQPVQSRAELRDSSLWKANGLDLAITHPDLGTVEMMGVPLVMEAAPGRVERHAPRPGEHTDEVRLEPARAPQFPPGDPGREPEAPLAGVKVIDLSSFIAGPVVSRHLAMLGAEVIKVEAPGGDPFRAFGPAFANWNQGKRSIVLDLTSDAGRAVLDQLVARADVVTENFRPGVAARLGAHHERLRTLNPDLVFLSSPGYGDDESLADAAAFDPLVQALGGLMYAQGGLGADGSGFAGPAADDGAEPVFLTVAIHDVVTPIIGAFATVSGLYHRARTGEAQRVRTSLAQATVVVQAAELTRVPGGPPTLAGGFDFRGPAEDRRCVEGEDGWWFHDGTLRAPIVRHGLVNEPIAADNGLLVTHDHPDFGAVTSFGQLVVGAGPPPGRAPLLDEHRDEILAELSS
jgi:crotonobetainyl-CoA:carnitine CoA-transferase CaiB-like acyl-CoA transferase